MQTIFRHVASKYSSSNTFVLIRVFLAQMGLGWVGLIVIINGFFWARYHKWVGRAIYPTPRSDSRDSFSFEIFELL